MCHPICIHFCRGIFHFCLVFYRQQEKKFGFLQWKQTNIPFSNGNNELRIIMCFFFVFSVFSPIGGNEKRYTHTQVNFTMTPNLISVVFDWLIYLLTKIEWKLAKKENEFLRGEETIRIFCVPYLAKQITAQPQLCTPLRHATQCSMLILQKCNKNENGK